MRLMTVVTIGALALAASCGGDEDGTTPIDAAIDMMPDGPTNALGVSCTGAPGQGSCPANHVCIGIQGGTGTFCSPSCTIQTTASCNVGYTGPGIGACFLATPGASEPTNCGIVCNDAPGAPEVCPAGECDNTCPGSLSCSGDLTMGLTGCQ